MDIRWICYDNINHPQRVGNSGRFTEFTASRPWADRLSLHSLGVGSWDPGSHETCGAEDGGIGWVPIDFPLIHGISIVKIHRVSSVSIEFPWNFSRYHWVSIEFPGPCQDWGVGGFAGKSRVPVAFVLGLPAGPADVWRFASSPGWRWLNGGELAPGSICWQTCGEGYGGYGPMGHGGWEFDGSSYPWNKLQYYPVTCVQVIGRGLGMLKICVKTFTTHRDHPLTDTLFLHITCFTTNRGPPTLAMILHWCAQIRWGTGAPPKKNIDFWMRQTPAFYFLGAF